MSQPQTETMDVSTEAKRIMVHALGKIYTLRTQRGGLRLHRSLLITLVMKSARDIYHSCRIASEQPEEQANFTGVTTESCQTGTDPAGVPRNVDSTPAPKTEVTENCPTTDVQSDPLYHNTGAYSEDKENQSSTSPDRQSRKRHGKAAVEPDFLPCKKAKMEAVDVRRNGALRATCCGVKDSLTHIPISRGIVSF